MIFSSFWLFIIFLSLRKFVCCFCFPTHQHKYEPCQHWHIIVQVHSLLALTVRLSLSLLPSAITHICSKLHHAQRSTAGSPIKQMIDYCIPDYTVACPVNCDGHLSIVVTAA